eukprot:491987-Heterocapsa_arctica.AAC.1
MHVRLGWAPGNDWARAHRTAYPSEPTGALPRSPNVIRRPSHGEASVVRVSARDSQGASEDC